MIHVDNCQFVYTSTRCQFCDYPVTIDSQYNTHMRNNDCAIRRRDIRLSLGLPPELVLPQFPALYQFPPAVRRPRFINPGWGFETGRWNASADTLDEID
jgi:hypothetical protein